MFSARDSHVMRWSESIPQRERERERERGRECFLFIRELIRGDKVCAAQTLLSPYSAMSRATKLYGVSGLYRTLLRAVARSWYRKTHRFPILVPGFSPSDRFPLPHPTPNPFRPLPVRRIEYFRAVRFFERPSFSDWSGWRPWKHNRRKRERERERE